MVVGQFQEVSQEGEKKMKEWREFELTMECFKKKLDIPQKCFIRQVSCLGDKTYVRILTYVEVKK